LIFALKILQTREGERMDATYGGILSKVVDTLAKHAEREEIFRRNNIPRGHYYNVINPNRETTAGNPFYCPTEWGVSLTRDSNDFTWIRAVAHDCNGLFIPMDDIQELNEIEPERALKLLLRIVGVISRAGGDEE
jgi:hypothetical protein